MGMVYLGYDHDCNRQVAIKKIRPELREDPEVQRRFHAEANLTADLENPGIIPIYAKGADQGGDAYYAMRLISQTGADSLLVAIDDFHTELRIATSHTRHQISNLRDRFRQLIQHLIDVSDTVSYAHSRDVVHRDLKPANVLIGPFGETLVADWGLAKRCELPADKGSNDPQSPTQNQLPEHTDPILSSTTGIGTPGYAAPELTMGCQGPALKLADIYSLGGTLHCILTGSAPCEKTKDFNKRQPEPSSLRVLYPTIHFLEAIASKAMAYDSAHRYQSPREFREDLIRWIAGEPISARRENLVEQAIRWPARHRATATGLASALAITFLATAGFLGYQSAQKNLLNRQAIQLKIALEDSSRLLVETRKAKALAESANQEAQTGQRLALQSKEIAQKREGLAFEALLRFQDILLNHQASFQSKELLGVHEQLVLQTKATFEGILNNLSENASPSSQTLRYLRILTHRLAALENFAGRPEQALTAIDQACMWMRNCLRLQDIQESIQADLQLRIGELRSLQANIGLLSGKTTQTLPIVDESIDLLTKSIRSEKLGIEDTKDATAALVQAYTALATIQRDQGHIDQAQDSQSKAIGLLSEQDPTTFQEAMAGAQSHYGMAILHLQKHETDRAIEQLQRAYEALVLAQRFNPDSLPLEFIAYRSQLSLLRFNVLQSKDLRQAAIEIIEQQLLFDHQAVQSFQAIELVLDSYQRNATLLQGLYGLEQRTTQASKVCNDWIQVSEELLRNHPKSEPAIHFAILANHIAGHLDRQLDQNHQALAQYRKAIESHQQADSLGIRTARLSYQRVELEMHVLELHYLIESEESAETIFQRALEAAKLLERLSDPESPQRGLAIEQLRRGIETMRAANDLKTANTSQANLESAGL